MYSLRVFVFAGILVKQDFKPGFGMGKVESQQYQGKRMFEISEDLRKSKENRKKWVSIQVQVHC